ncbi:MAG: MaoC/PaaZ C-terminal domain-containing protein [Myxococcales bacterium]|nr:MaoC/PaaZ C-terminal domain-containing protein [Myxococcales bacterium]
MLQQGPVIAALLRAARGAALSAFRGGRGPMPLLPGPEDFAIVPPLPASLVADYLRHLGSDRAAYPGQVPPHLFPQWLFPMQARSLEALPYPMHRVLNGGCRMQIQAPLPLGEPLEVRARLEGIEEDERRAVLRLRASTGPASAPRSLITDLYAIVPLRRAAASAAGKRERKPRPRVPEGVRELARWQLDSKAGLDFAKLTGDFNPIHWIPAYARVSGFSNVILHGFATLARAYEGLARALLAGDPTPLSFLDARFVRPLILPASVGLYVRGREAWVGDGPGGPAYLEARFALRSEREGVTA